MQLNALATPAPEVLVILVPAAVFILGRAAACIPAPEGACTQDRGAASILVPAAAFTRDRPQTIPTRIMVRSVPASQVQRTIVG